MIILILILASCNLLVADQQESTDIELTSQVDKVTYEEIKNDLDFSKTKNALRPKEAKPKKKKESDEEEEKKKERSQFSNLQDSGIFQLLSYILIFMLVSFLVYLIFSNIKVEKKFELSTDDVSLDDIDDIQALDTNSLLAAALANKDHRSAVRIKFLAVLKKLSAQEKINWRKEKTNRDYSRELREESYGKQFNELTNIFDHVWYGKQQLTESHYSVVDKQFNSFSTLMNE